MESSQVNPFESPQTTSSFTSVEASNLQHQSLTARAIFGVWAGVFYGGTFGAGGSVAFGLTGGMVMGWHTIGPGIDSIESFIVNIVAAAIVGAVAGVLSGCVIGPIIVFFASIKRRRARAALILGMVLSMMVGAYLGYIGGKIIGAQNNTTAVAMGLGIPIGILSGLVGGYQLGSGVLEFTRTPDQNSAAA